MEHKLRPVNLYIHLSLSLSLSLSPLLKDSIKTNIVFWDVMPCSLVDISGKYYTSY